MFALAGGRRVALIKSKKALSGTQNLFIVIHCYPVFMYMWRRVKKGTPLNIERRVSTHWHGRVQ